MNIKNRIKAHKYNKKTFIIPTLKNRIVFAENMEQCKSKFTKHNPIQTSKVRHFIYVIFGI